MSLHLINQYYNELDRIQRFSGSKNEDTVKGAFVNLVNGLARQKNLELVREVQIQSRLGTTVRPDGILRSILQLDYGYWESKDTKDDLLVEIEAKFNKGYPRNNILFEDTQTAILFQENERILVKMTDAAALLELLHIFINYERPEVAAFNQAIVQFGRDLPNILDKLRTMIEAEAGCNPLFVEKRNQFLQLCQNSINPNLDLLDMREMLIQHILTEEIFISIFNNADYHRENNIAQSLYEVEKTFFRGQTKQNLLAEIRPYYNTVKARANEMVSHAEKQKFLKIIYENFYKSYNPEAADRLGIVYTPNEIVDFMIDGCDFLLERHFSKTLGSKGVEILDPCTGTGTFVTQLIEHIPPQQLVYKYEFEIHANEMALLPYYVANLNIEAVYQQKMGNFREFNNLCFVDTLDNTHALTYFGKQSDMFGAVSLENVARIKRQNSKTISVIIGNPPYNANQMNENDNNKNREYFFDYKKKIGGVDGRIKDTYVKASTAQKTKQYDMYKRFIRWASDRISENGIICFICNRSFIDKRQDNGFRKIVEQEFDFIYILDLGGNLHGEGAEAADNVFGITIGVAMVWLGKKSVKTKLDKARIFYHRFPTAPNKSVKLEMIQQTRFESVDFERIAPDEKGNWLNEGIQDDFDSLIPLCSRETKLKGTGNTIFRLYSNGVSTNRDDWVYDFSKENLIKKMKFFFDQYNSEVDRWIDWKAENNYIDIKAESNPVVDDFLHARNLIKWSGRIKRDKLRKHKKGSFDESDIVRGLYRPFTQMFLYYGYIPIDLKGEFKTIFPNNLCIVFNNGMLQSFNALAVDLITDLHFNGDSVCLPLYCYEDSQQVENITDWALRLFRENYADGVGCINAVSCTKNIEDSKVYDASLMHPTQVVIEKLDIFHYVYAVLHDPNYRQKYAQNLKRDFPRIPLYDDFWTWANWGKQLMELHLNYEHAPRYEFTRIDRPLKNPAAKPKVKLKADKLAGKIEVDEITTLSDIPAQAWQYQLGNRSALEWILDQYREKKIADPTLAEKFDNYPFADYKEQAIELLEKVCTVSVKTVEIIEEMPN